MGHVSDFNGLNNCEETDMSQTSSDLLSADNILDFNLADSILPFSDDTYQQSSLYASSLTSLMQNDDDRNGYFDEPMFDLLFDSDNHFNIDFDAPDALVGERAQVLETDPSKALAVNSYPEEKNNSSGEESSTNTVLTKQSASLNEVNDDSRKSDQLTGCDVKKYTAETVFKISKSPDAIQQVPKIVIKLEPESKITNQSSPESKNTLPKLTESKSFALELSLADCAPMTIADNVKLGRRRTVNVKTEKTEGSESKKSSDAHRKKKKHHKKESKPHKLKSPSKELSDIRKKHDRKAYTKLPVDHSPDVNSHNLSKKISYASTESKHDFYSDDGEQGYYLLTSPVSVEPDVDVEGDEANSSAVDSYELDLADGSLLSALSPIGHAAELDNSVHDILEDLEIALGDGGNIPDLPKTFLDDIPPVNGINESKADSFSSSSDKTRQGATEKLKAAETKLSASELIDELHAHNQQVFEEIEISTPDLELELTDMKNSIQIVNSGTSQNMPNSANGVLKQNGVPECVKIEPNSENYLPGGKTSSDYCSMKPSLPELVADSSTRSRKISNSSSCFSSKSTSHRTYRKRRSRLRSSSSSSSSSDTEKFYNRPVKYDPVTDSYLDEFGREVRPTELKRYLKPKSSHQDSYSNHGSSSSTYSRSRSPSSKSHRRKHNHHSKSRSQRKRHFSSSHSRSRSRDRKKKDSRQHSSKHQSRKPHYMDLEENVKANEERRVMYVGDIPPGFTVEMLKERFSAFGPIQDATIKSKATSDNALYIFGFVTFRNRMDACNAIENGNKNPKWPKFELNFGGRRRFCNGNYTDLDGKVAEYESGWYGHVSSYRCPPVQEEVDDFAELLRLEQRRLGMTK